ncbi:MAG TPA: thioredoxin-disulfide reductase [Bacillota bacterium]|nr:thioredoxin-disulfide reductase [Bacillota bacterium]HOH10027.1 thioredoxin-disulfide reductase [Bacillota bacterium]HOY88605.1 thioredoxin-disulfide reductase [Bacillota bacterium]HPI01716.1 thioredoxin-disulfide reductase [Bacillota bacterium]HPM63266.1 thioredoxin-disulfide reductase [Bacillota bacterium]
MKDLVIIGSGPAGMAAGIYARRGGLDTTLIEKVSPGGQAVYAHSIENYPGSYQVPGYELMFSFANHLEKFGLAPEVMEITGTELSGKVKLVHTQSATIEAKAVVIASGASPRKLGMPNEGRLTGRGVSYCASCDGNFFKGKVAAVVGGGDAAAEDALYLAKICSKVYVIHRRDSLRAQDIVQKRLFAMQNVEMVWNSVTEDILGEEKVESLLIRDVNDKTLRELPTDSIFVAIGQVPNTGLFAKEVSLAETGHIIVDREMRTNVPGVFAAGDVTVKPLRQVVTAVSDGAVASYSAIKYISTEF